MINKKPKKLDEGYTQILLEDMKTQMQLIAEQHGSIVKKLDKLDKIETTVDKLEIDVSALKSLAKVHSRDIDKIKSGSTALYMKVDELKDDVNILKDDVREVKEGQTRIEQKLELRLDSHEKRILKLEETTLAR